MGIFLQGDWRWEDGSVFNYNNVDSLASVEQYQCLMVNSDGKDEEPTQTFTGHD